jgi:hypothetical protein
MEAALAAAFETDPPLRFLLPDADREHRLRAYFSALIPLYGAPWILNASSPRSRDLYLRHGFAVLSEFRLPFGGPPLWRMRRAPR